MDPDIIRRLLLCPGISDQTYLRALGLARTVVNTGCSATCQHHKIVNVGIPHNIHLRDVLVMVHLRREVK